MRWRPLLVCLLLAAASAGCGGSSSSGDSPTKETTDPPAPVPRGWARLINEPAGFSLSLPPGWTKRRSGDGSTLVRSKDRALAVAVSKIRLGEVSPWLFANHPMGNPPVPDGYAWGLPLLYLVWAVAIVILYFPCRWFTSIKTGGTAWWLRYL